MITKLPLTGFWIPGLEEKTMIEQHVGNLDKSHMYYLTEKRPMRQRKSDEGGEESKGFDVKKIPIIEIQIRWQTDVRYTVTTLGWL